MTYPSVILADTPTAYYKTEEASGTSATDSSGNSLTGTLSASDITYEADGLLLSEASKALLFGGTSGTLYRQLTGGDVPSYPFCLEMWIDPDTVSAGEVVLAVGSDTDQQAASIRVGADNAWRIVAENPIEDDTQDGGPRTGGPQHLFARFVSATERYLYVDSQCVVSITNGTTISLPFGVGNIYLAVANLHNFPGYAELSASHVAYYNHDVSPARVRAHYGAGVTGFRLYDNTSGELLATPTAAATTFDLSTLGLPEGRYEFGLSFVGTYGCESDRAIITASIGAGGSPASELRTPQNVRASALAGGVIQATFGIEPAGTGLANPASFQVAYLHDPATVIDTVTFDVSLARYTVNLPALADGLTRTVIVRSTDGASAFSQWFESLPVVTDASGPPAPVIQQLEGTCF